MARRGLLGMMTVAAMIAMAWVPTQAGADVTVGEFIQRLAREKSLAGNDAQDAAESLRAAGFLLPNGLDASASLTEGHVAAIGRALGLKIRTSRPDAGFDRIHVERFVGSFKRELRKPGSGQTKGHAAPGTATTERVKSSGGSGKGKGKGTGPGTGKGKGKGKGKGPDATPSSVE